jgi:hypothetical protein
MNFQPVGLIKLPHYMVLSWGPQFQSVKRSSFASNLKPQTFNGRRPCIPPARRAIKTPFALFAPWPAPLCPVEFTCDSGAYSSGVGRNYRTGVKFSKNSGVYPVKPVRFLFNWGVFIRGGSKGSKSSSARSARTY